MLCVLTKILQKAIIKFMKYLKILLFLFIFWGCILSVCAEYKQIPKELSLQYKTEMEQIINREYPNALKNADDCVKKIKKIHDKMIKYGYNENDYIDMNLLQDVNLFASDLELYAELMKITQEKYLKIKYEPIGTDNANPIYEYLFPYFTDNNVDKTRLNQIDIYINKKTEISTQYINHINKLFLYRK